MQSKIKYHINTILPKIVEMRHQLHRYPEVANEEFHTAEAIIKILKQFGYTTAVNIAHTGVMAVLDSGKPGKTMAIRSEMDALPIQEESNLPFQSKVNGKMHACGHDGHMAILVGTAYVLMKCKDHLNGKVKFIFQPAEEIGEGSRKMIEAGVLKNPDVDAIFGYHNMTRYESRKLAVKKGFVTDSGDKDNIPSIFNSAYETELVFDVGKKVLGQANILSEIDTIKASEDFANYLEEVSGCFMFIGNGSAYGKLHQSDYQFNDDIIPCSIEILSNLALAYLNANF